MLFGLAFSPDSERLATGGNSQMIRVWRAGTTNLLGSYTGHFGEIWDLQFSRDGEQLGSASADGTARLWSAHSSPGEGFSVPGDQEVLRIARDGSRLWLADTNLTTLFERELPGCGMEKTTVLETNRVTLLPSPSVRLLLITERALICGSPDGHLWGWDWETGELVLTNRVSDGYVIPQAATSNAGLAYGLEVTSSRTNGVLWNLEFGGAEAVFSEAAFTGWAAFSPDDRWLAYGVRDGSWRLYDVVHRRERAVLRGHEWNPYCARFTADGRRLVTCGWEPSPRIWDVATGRLAVAPLVGHRSGVHMAAFPPDGRTLVTGGGDRTLRFWNVATGQEVTLARPCSLALFYSGVLAPDGSGFLETAGERRLRYIQLPSLVEIDAAE
jgi:WD40 repeat protein